MQYDVCVKFASAPKWFYTEGGSNAPCNPSKTCCEWYPPFHSPCHRNIAIYWWETDSDCKASFEALNISDPKEVYGVPYIFGATKGEKRTVCTVTNPTEFASGSAPETIQQDVTMVYCGEKCCIYEVNQ